MTVLNTAIDRAVFIFIAWLVTRVIFHHDTLDFGQLWWVLLGTTIGGAIVTLAINLAKSK